MVSIRRQVGAVAVVFAALACAAGMAHADDRNRLYIAGYMGLNIFPEQELTEEAVGTSGEIGFKKGYNFAGAIGFKLTPHLRLEGELSYLNTNADGMNLDGIGGFSLNGGIDTKIAMINLYYDIDLGWRLQPFVGGGLGYGWHDVSINSFSGYSVNVSEESDGYMWQLGGGLRYPVNDNVNLVTGYRFMDGKDLRFGDYIIDHAAHEFRVGLSWDLPYE